MDNSNYLYLNTSILYRCGQKYYDKKLSGHDINAAQILFLILIYEQEGLNMQQLAQRDYHEKHFPSGGAWLCDYTEQSPGQTYPIAIYD